MADLENKLSVFPAFFKVKGQRVVVVGNGVEALNKLRLLEETDADLVAVAPAPDAALQSFIEKKTISWLNVPFHESQLQDAALIFAAEGDIDADQRVADAARAARIPLNVVDRPELCDFYTPAIVNRAPIAVAIGSEGTGPVLTQLIRARIDALLCPSLGRLARFAQIFRGRAKAIPNGAERRSFWASFFNGSVARAIETGDEKAAMDAAEALLDGKRGLDGHVFLMSVSHAKADQLTLRGQRALMEADLIIYDDNVNEDIVKLGRRDAERRIAPRNVRESVWQSRSQARQGRQVVRLYASDYIMAEEIVILSESCAAFDIIASVSDENDPAISARRIKMSARKTLAA